LTDVEVVSILKELSGEVVISSERVLPSHLESQRFKGSSLELHGDLARKKQLITESPTMAVEALFLGVPRIIYVSRRIPWYIQALAGAYPHLLLASDYKNIRWALRADVETPNFEKLNLEKKRSQRLIQNKLDEIGLNYA
jgi:predicted glycosyltransferase